MDFPPASDIFWPLTAIVLLHVASLAMMAVVLRLFRHVRRKEYDLLARFSNADGTGNAVPVHKRSPYLVGGYVLLTVGFAVATILVLVFQPHIL